MKRTNDGIGGAHGAPLGVNLLALRSHNTALVLDLLRTAGAEGISRLELAERTGLTPQAVSKITARLRADGLAAEAGRRASTGGKPRTVLRLVPEAGHAVADVLFGKVNPGGKLPVTFPRAVGQVPIYYNHKSTGRPPNEADKYTSKYLDVPWTPLYPFGHGLSYTTFRLSALRLSAGTIAADGTLTVSVDVENAGDRAGDEVVQLYVTDVVRSVSPPVQELKGFERVALRPGERRRVELVLGSEHLGFYDRRMQWVVEPGEFSVRVSNSSVGGLTGRFEVR